jgi:hypothetical protein
LHRPSAREYGHARGDVAQASSEFGLVVTRSDAVFPCMLIRMKVGRKTRCAANKRDENDVACFPRKRWWDLLDRSETAADTRHGDGQQGETFVPRYALLQDHTRSTGDEHGRDLWDKNVMG